MKNVIRKQPEYSFFGQDYYYIHIYIEAIRFAAHQEISVNRSN